MPVNPSLRAGHPVFPGENEQEQLAMIIEVIDLPPTHVLDQGTRRKLFFGSFILFHARHFSPSTEF